MSALNKEAAVILTALVGAISAVIGLLVAFGIDVSDSQQTAIVATVISFSTLIVLVGPVIRTFVFSKQTTQLLVNEAAVTGDTNIGSPPKGK